MARYYVLAETSTTNGVTCRCTWCGATTLAAGPGPELCLVVCHRCVMLAFAIQYQRTRRSVGEDLS